MHHANTSAILASLSDSMETDPQHAADWFDLLIYQPDPEDLEQSLHEFE